MRNADFAPLYRSTVGFDRLIEMLDNSIRPEWPQYDIERIGDRSYRISMAVAGFSIDEIELIQQGNVLLISSKKAGSNAQRKGMLHQGLALRNFRQTFNLADHVKVKGANLVNGMLTIDLTRELPEALQPRRIAIGSDGPREPTRQIVETAPEPGVKAA